MPFSITLPLTIILIGLFGIIIFLPLVQRRKDDRPLHVFSSQIILLDSALLIWFFGWISLPVGSLAASFHQSWQFLAFVPLGFLGLLISIFFWNKHFMS